MLATSITQKAAHPNHPLHTGLQWNDLVVCGCAASNAKEQRSILVHKEHARTIREEIRLLRLELSLPAFFRLTIFDVGLRGVDSLGLEGWIQFQPNTGWC
jgi:hypothetical protein